MPREEYASSPNDTMNWLLAALAEKNQSEDTTDVEQLRRILELHAALNFVKRLQMGESAPRMDLGDGWVGTHQMSWTEVGPERRPIVYPNIVQDPANPNSPLLWLSPRKAVQYALRSGEYIPVRNRDEAQSLSSQYKRINWWK